MCHGLGRAFPSPSPSLPLFPVVEDAPLERTTQLVSSNAQRLSSGEVLTRGDYVPTLMQPPSPWRPLLDSRVTLATSIPGTLLLGHHTGSKTLVNLFLELLHSNCTLHAPTDFDPLAPQVVRTVHICNSQSATARTLWRQQ